MYNVNYEVATLFLIELVALCIFGVEDITM